MSDRPSNARPSEQEPRPTEPLLEVRCAGVHVTVQQIPYQILLWLGSGAFAAASGWAAWPIR